MILEVPAGLHRRRAVFGLAHALGVLAVYWLWIIPVQDYFTERSGRIAAQQALLARLEGVAAEETAVQDLISRSSAELDRNEFLTGTNDGVIGADLQTRLKAIAEAGGARVKSVQSLQPTRNEAIKYVGARIDLSGTHAAIQRTVHAIETNKPYLFITSAVIKGPPNGPPNATTEPFIDAQLEIVGAILADEGAK
ncbi:type II secretion system protein GspM [Bradyrhizobium sp. INPA03-11B]|uniref:type II secretion system protein GspM n=1 Tax=Bradyrhizobium sp. INPA03-11B TaxID=418598 RepID=UPI00338E628D